MIETPWASVVIPTYGVKGAKLTRACLTSLRQTHDHMFPETFIVSDGDDGEALDLLQALATEFEVELVRIEREGFAAACNAGIERANGEYSVFLVNNDILFTEESLQVLADAQTKLRAGVIGCRLLYPDLRIQHAGVVFVPTPEGPLPGYFDHLCRFEDALDPDAVVMRTGLVTGALLGVSREFIMRSGLLDRRFGFTAEDIDLGLRSFQCGMPPVYLGYTHAIHQEGASRGRTLEEKLALEPEVAEKEAHSLAFLFQKWTGLDFMRFSAQGMHAGGMEAG